MSHIFFSEFRPKLFESNVQDFGSIRRVKQFIDLSYRKCNQRFFDFFIGCKLKSGMKLVFRCYLLGNNMDQSFNTTGRISLAIDVVPRLLYTNGKTYLDFYSIRHICGGEAIAKTTLFCLLKELPNVQNAKIKYRNRTYIEESFVLINLKHLIFN